VANEPVVALVVALIVAGGGLLAAFGVDVTDAQIAALSTFAVAALGLALYVRSKVTPTAKPMSRRDLKDEINMRKP
jgi:hypothetical protein